MLRPSRLLTKILVITLVCLMLGPMFGALPSTAYATSEKTTISVTDSSPYFTQGTNSGISTWYPHTYNGHDYISTYVGGMPGNPSQPDGWAKFKPYLSQPGEYEVYAYFYTCEDTSTKVPFIVYYNGGSITIKVNQFASSPAWREVKLGSWDFASGESTFVTVTDATGEPYDSHKGLTIGAIKFVKVQTATAPSPPTHLSPSNGATDVSLSPTFRWNSVSNADYYGLYISEPPYDSSHLVFDSEGDYGPIYGTSFILPSGKLSPGIKYYWNMASHNSRGWSYDLGTGFSDSWYFTTKPPVDNIPTVSIASPFNNQYFPYSTSGVTIQGTANDDHQVTLVQVRVNSGSWATASGTTSWSKSVNLVVGANTIEAKAKDDNNQYSTVASITVYREQQQPPSPPSHISPSNGAMGQTTPTFQWNSVSGADYYGLYIRDITSGEGPIVFDSEVNYGPISGTSFNLPSGYLSNSKTYRWNMRSHNSAGWGTSFSTGWTFSTQPPPEPLNKPTPISPGEALGSSHTPIPGDSITFRWNKNNTGATYSLYVRDITGYDDFVGTDVGTLVINGLNVGDVDSYVWGGAGAEKKYRWQVEAVKGSPTALSDRLVFVTETSDSQNVYNTAFITDSGFTDANALSLVQIRDLLQSQNSPLAGTITDTDGASIDPALLFYNAANQYSISPKVLLATAEKETTAVTGSNWQSNFLSKVMGYPTNLADTAREQIDSAAWQFRKYLTDLAQTGQTQSGWQVGTPKLTEDGVEVAPANKAVAALFTYTPYAGVQWGGDDPQWGGNYLFYDAWYNKFHFDEEATPVTVPSQILSPVTGALEVVSTLDACSNTKWCFNQHQTGGHGPGGGIGQADDTFAWDANLNYPTWDADAGNPVYVVASGIVTDTYGSRINAGGSYGQVLVEHTYQGNTWWSGYLHLTNIQVSPGQTVTENTVLGYISNISPESISNHLHLAVYSGSNTLGGLVSFNVSIVERAPTNEPPTITDLGQFQSDGITAIPEGGSTDESTVVFKGTVSDPEGDTVKLEIELRETSQPFTGSPTPETISEFFTSGSQVTITRYGLVNGDYHWQARAVDDKGEASPWVEFGTTGNTDFKVVYGRQQLIEAVRGLEDAIADSIEYDTGRVADSYGLLAVATELTPWWRELARIALDTIHAVVDIAMQVRDFLTPSGSTQALENPSTLQQLINGLRDSKEILGDIALFQGFVGLYQNADSYKLYFEAVNRTEEVALEAYQYNDNFDDAADAAWLELWLPRGTQGIWIPLKSGAPLSEGSRPTDVLWANGTKEVKTQINHAFDDFVSQIPDPLPSGYPLDETIQYLDELEQQVRGVTYRSVPFKDVDSGIEKERRVTLGMVSEGREVTSDLYDAWLNELDVQYTSTLLNTGETILHVTSYGIPASGITKEVMKGISDLYEAVELIQLPSDLGSLIDKSVPPLDALQYHVVKMTDDLIHESANLWALSDATIEYLHYTLGQTEDGTPPETVLTLTNINDSSAAFAWEGSDDTTAPSALLYSHYLEGYEANWSEWGNSKVKSYSGLPNGNYTFRVKTKDQAGNMDPTPAEYAFTINGPQEPDYALAEWITSHNYSDASRGTQDIQYIIVHTMQGTLEGTSSWFQTPASEVSSHYLVGSEGKMVQMVKEEDIAWHAMDYNSTSIGIEHEGWTTDPDWPTEAMYQASANLVRYLCRKYDVPMDRSHILGHDEIYSRPDPGQYWDWDYYMQLVTFQEPDIGSIDPIDFGSVTVGNSQEQTTTISNNGTATLTINSIVRTSGDSDFTYVGPSTPFNVKTGSPENITICFAPSTTGDTSATFTVNSNDPDSPAVTFSVSGSGMPTPVHNVDTGEDFQSIQAAVDDPDTQDGHTIIVEDGTYNENVDVNKSLTIRSENGASSTIVQAANPDDHVFEVAVDHTEISGFTATGATGNRKAGIFLHNTHSCNIADNNASGNRKGIYLYTSNNNTLINNTANSNWENGIRLMASSGNVLINNTTSSDFAGISLTDLSDNNTLSGNVANSNRLSGIELYESHGNTLANNAVCNNNSKGIELAYSDCNTLSNNNVSSNLEAGIKLIGSANNGLADNTASNNEGIGIYLEECSDGNALINNIANSNYHSGISLRTAGDNTIKNNTCRSNNIGISFWGSNSNTVYLNNFGDNTGANAGYYDSSTNINTWHSPEEITYTYNAKTYTSYLGNYWSDYSGSDANRDGIGDTPYSINSDNDGYPLMEPFGNYVELPNLVSFDFTPKVADTTDGTCQVEVRVGVSGNLSSIEGVMVQFQAPHGLSGKGPGFGFPDLSVPPDGVIIDSLTFPQYAERGEWTIIMVSLRLNLGSSLNWSTAELQALGFPTVLTVTNSLPDNNPPVLSNFDFAPKVVTLSPGDTAEVKTIIGVQDPSEVRICSMDFIQPGVAVTGWSFEDVPPHSGTPTDGVFESAYNWSLATGPEGTYLADNILLVDGVGNYEVWNTNDLVSLGFPTTLEVIFIPSVSSVSPAVNATDIAVDTVITATFNEAMDSSTITTQGFTLSNGGAVSGTVTYDSTTHTTTFTPSASLEYGQPYTATLSTAITDAAGNPLAQAYTWSFTTVAGVIVSVNAPEGVPGNYDFTVTIDISQVENFDAANYNISFDPSVLRLDSVTSGNINGTSIPVDIANETAPGAWTIVQNVPGLTGVTGSGHLVVLHFHSIGSIGDSSNISLANGVLSNNEAGEIPATWVGGSVEVSVIPGDANGDGNVNAIDITKVERIIAGLDATTPGADANQDGNVNAIDITKVERIIAGLD